jgi:hypothetical protein
MVSHILWEKKTQQNAFSEIFVLHPIGFWEGKGPSLILIPPGDEPHYDLEGYRQRFEDPRAMWEAEMARARKVADWPTDGIPTVRPNLGVVLVPALAGQPCRLESGSMPWPGDPLTEKQIRAAVPPDTETCELLGRALEFYRVHREEGGRDVAAYLADTQSVFDIAHLLWGDETFVDLADPDREEWVHELMEISLQLYLSATRAMKDALGEADGTMVHGHATSQGVYFPHAGVRASEDTATLLSPDMIQRIVVPYLTRCAEPFGGVFVHYCGKRDDLFQTLAALPFVRAIDLGNPEMYALDDLLRWCAESGTVLYSRLPAEPDEDWKACVNRIGKAVHRNGARVVLRPLTYPASREECSEMLELWREYTT